MQQIMKRSPPFAMLALALAPLAAPLLAASHPLAALFIRSFFSQLCHQNPARSLVIHGSPAAVCVRCLGIYCGAGLGMLMRLGRTSAVRIFSLALLLNLLDVASAALEGHGNMPATRFLLGLLLGVAAGSVLFPAETKSLSGRQPGPR
jgi:uncharacterized membrane protein